MKTRHGIAGILALTLLSGAVTTQSVDDGWTSIFSCDKDELVTTGRNPYFILEPGYQLVFEGGMERLVITVLKETRIVDDVETRIVEERETNGGELVEVSRNFYAISKRTNCVFYFGEEVDIYKDGKIASHDGAWISGMNGARFGLMMPGQILMGGKYYQEVAPGVAMDRAEIVGATAIVETKAAQFGDCLKIEETTPLEPDDREYKYYAQGVGLVQDGNLKLVRFGQADVPEP